MAERKAVNKYYPPEYDPAVHGSLNAYRGHHPLGNRVRKKLRESGAVVVRFEMPFNAWCDTCHTHLARGTRYNAEQRRVGKYHSTPVYSFTMRCACCGCTFVIETDPARADYRATAGATRKTEEWAQESSLGYALPDAEARERRQHDVMFAVEQQQQDRERAAAVQKELRAVARAVAATTADDYSANALARKYMRQRRAAVQEQRSKCSAMGITVVEQLAPTTEEDEAELLAARAERRARQTAAARERTTAQALRARTARSNAFATTTTTTAAPKESAQEPEHKRRRTILTM